MGERLTTMTDHWPPKFLLIPAVTLFLLVSILPIGWMLCLFLAGIVQDPQIAEKTIMTYRQMILLGRSFQVAGLSTLVSLCLGLPVAVIIAAEELPLRRFCWTLTLLPLLIPPYILAGAWIHLLSPNSILNHFLINTVGFPKGLSVFNMTGCIWCLGISFFPVIALVVATGIVNLDRSVLDITRLSTGPWGSFRYGILPQLFHPILASSCLVMIFCLGRYGVPSLLGVNTYPVEIFAQFSAFYDEKTAIATSIPLLLIVITLILIQRKLMTGRRYLSITPGSDTASHYALGAYRYIGLLLFVIILVVTTLLPFLSVVLKIRNPVIIINAITSSMDDIVTTLLLGIGAALISLVIAYPVAYYLSRQEENRYKQILDVLCWLPIAVPGTIIGLGILGFSTKAAVMGTQDSYGFFLLIAYVAMFCPFAIRILEASFRQTDPSIQDMAALYCRHWYQRMFYVDLLVHSKAIIASLLFVLIFVSGELTATVLLIPPGKATLAITIDNLLHYGANAKASALCLVQAVFVLVMLLAGSSLWRKSTS